MSQWPRRVTGLPCRRRPPASPGRVKAGSVPPGSAARAGRLRQAGPGERPRRAVGRKCSPGRQLGPGAARTGAVSGGCRATAGKASAACSTSMPRPSARRPAPWRRASAKRRWSPAVHHVVGQRVRGEGGGREHDGVARQAGRGGVDHQVEGAGDFAQAAAGDVAVVDEEPHQFMGPGGVAVGDGEAGDAGVEEGPATPGGAAGPEQEDAAAGQGSPRFCSMSVTKPAPSVLSPAMPSSLKLRG